MAAPKTGMLRSQEWKRGEDLLKQKAASSKKGVVGRIGKKAPTIPKQKKIQPQIK
ncbi:MAG: hypothetical protein K2P81_12085 [Bacteriovoracaceae bacterium]|nr:hypothetical protein [Bacteriovoracaceae bacterium]